MGEPSKFKPLPENEKKICWRVGAIRRLRGLSQNELAHKIGLTRNQLANIEAKRVPLKFGTAITLCRQIKVNPAWLYNGEGAEKLNLDLDDPFCAGLLKVPSPAVVFSWAWAAFGDDLKFFGNSTQRKIETQGKEGKTIAETASSYKGPFALPVEDWHKPQKAGFAIRKNISKSPLDIQARLSDNETVKQIRSLPELVTALRTLTKARGAKADLARKCQVSRQAVNQWLSGSQKKPKISAEATFLALEWVREHNVKTKNALAVL